MAMNSNGFVYWCATSSFSREFIFSVGFLLVAMFPLVEGSRGPTGYSVVATLFVVVFIIFLFICCCFAVRKRQAQRIPYPIGAFTVQVPGQSNGPLPPGHYPNQGGFSSQHAAGSVAYPLPYPPPVGYSGQPATVTQHPSISNNAQPPPAHQSTPNSDPPPATIYDQPPPSYDEVMRENAEDRDK